MTTALDLADSVFEETVERAVREVFNTMLSTEAELMPMAISPEVDALHLTAPQVVGTVGFIGAMNGLIYLYFEVGFAANCAARLLGMTEEEIHEVGDEGVNDAIGELTNMTVGTFKNQLADRGFPCRLTIPSILRASHFSIEPISSATRRTYQFAVGKHRVIADLLMQPSD
jgi:chemotaxis protein CheX